MIWDCFLFWMYQHIIEGKIDSIIYCKLLENFSQSTKTVRLPKGCINLLIDRKILLETKCLTAMSYLIFYRVMIAEQFSHR